MSITENIESVQNEILTEVQTDFPEGGGPRGTEVHQKAVKAIVGGAADWVEYMKLFADPAKPEQLARLIPTDGTVSDKHQEARAYLVRNGVCLMGTNTDLLRNVRANEVFNV
jgi:hypothetical protein